MADPEILGRTAELFAVIANPIRLAVLVALQERGTLSAGEIQVAVGVESSALSHHLRQLRDAALVDVQPQGRHRLYALADHHVAHIVGDALSHVRCREQP